MSHILVFRVATELVDRGITVRHLVSWDGLIAYHGHLCTRPSQRHLMVLPLSAPSKHKYEPHNPDSTLVSTFISGSTAEFVIKSLKEGQNHGFDPSLRKLSIKSLLARRVLELLFKVGETFGTSSFHLVSNFERILGSKIGYAQGTCCLKSPISLCKASLAHPSK